MIGIPQLFQQVLAWLNATLPAGSDFWIYGILTLAVMIEGPFSILFASSIASSDLLSPGYVFIAASLGNLIGDTLWYSLGYFSRFDWISRLQRFVKADPEKLASLVALMKDQAVKILVMAKLTNGLIVPALIATGILQIPLRKWFPYIFIANAMVTGSFVAFGYYVGSYLLKHEEGFRYLAAASSILMFLVITWLIRRWLKKKFIEKALAAPGTPEILNGK